MHVLSFGILSSGEGERLRLNLGCGFDIKKGWVNCDFVPALGVDMCFDLTKHPLPFEDNSVDEILALGILEHLIDWESVLIECHRVLAPSGVITISVPYGMDYRAYHVRFFKDSVMRGFYGDSTDGYEGCSQYPFKKPPFKLVSLRVERVFWLGWHFKHYLGIGYWAVKDPRNGNTVSRRYTFPIGRRDTITWVLKKV